MRTLFVVVGVVLVTVVTPALGSTAGNEAPLADAGLDQEVEQGQSVVLDATGSRDPDGTISSYEWTITAPNGSGMTPQCESCPRTEFAARQDDRYEVTVEVTDHDGASSRDTLYVDVDPVGGSPTEGAGPGPGGIATAGTPETTVPASSAGPRGTVSMSASEVSCTPDEFRLGHDCVGVTLDPRVTVSGPDRVTVGTRARFGATAHNFEGAESYRWSIDGDGSSASTSWNTPGVKRVVVSVLDESGNYAATQTSVRVVENQPPTVSITDPGDFSPGNTVRLSASKEDPDGEIVDTEWSPSSTVTVPTDGAVTVGVTVIDDVGNTASDTVKLHGRVQRETVEATVYCYYTKESQKKRGNPHHCEEPSATKGSSADGFSTAPAGYDWYKSHEYSIAWKKVPEEELNSDKPGQVEGLPSDIDEEAYETTEYEGLPEDATKPEEITDTDQLGSFTMNGDTVYSDLTGDGEINAADWDQRYGSNEENAEETNENIAGDLKDMQESRGTMDTSDASNSGSNNNSDTSSDNSDSSSNVKVDESGEQNEEAVDQFKNTQRSSSSSNSSRSSSGSESSSSSSISSSNSSSNSSSSKDSSSSSSSSSSGGLDDGIDYTGGLGGETSKGGTGHATHSF